MGLFNNKIHEEILRLYDKMDRGAEKLDRRLEKMDARVDNIDKSLAVYNEQLKVHIQGVEQARIENKQLREYIDVEVTKITRSISPITKHLVRLQNITWFLVKIGGLVAAILGVAYTLKQLGLY